MKNITLVISIGLLVLIVPQFAVAQNGRFVGTWKVNVAKSRYQPEDSAPRTETLRFDAVGDRITVTLDGVNRQGLYHSESTGKFDGVDVPVQAAPAPQQATLTYAFRRVDDDTWEIVVKINGQPRILVHNIVSADGKTMTGVWRAATSQGQQMSDVVIYEKQ